jgi:hypothetical protein
MMDDEENGQPDGLDDDFASGFDEEAEAQTKGPVEKSAPGQPEKADAPPEYMQITKKDWQELQANMAKFASYDRQFSSAHGNIGNLRIELNRLAQSIAQQQSRGNLVEIPADAFDDLKDFPEFQQASRKAIEKALSGVKVGGGGGQAINPAEVAAITEAIVTARDMSVLEETYENWRDIVGAVGRDQQPDPNNQFRRWLKTKGATYEKRINDTLSPAIIQSAIGRFQSEMKQRQQQVRTRSRRLDESVQPRGDGMAPSAGKSLDDQFESGFWPGR